MRRLIAAVDHDLLAAYREMSEDEIRETEALEWIEGLIDDAAPQPFELQSAGRG